MTDAIRLAKEVVWNIQAHVLGVAELANIFTRDREEVRAEERKACADRFMIKLEECIEPLPNKVEGIITGSDIERLYSAILSPEPVEPSESKESAMDDAEWKRISEQVAGNSDVTPAQWKLLDDYVYSLLRRIAKEGI